MEHSSNPLPFGLHKGYGGRVRDESLCCYGQERDESLCCFGRENESRRFCRLVLEISTVGFEFNCLKLSIVEYLIIIFVMLELLICVKALVYSSPVVVFN